MDRIFIGIKTKSNPIKNLLDEESWKKLNLFCYIPTLFWFADWKNSIDLLLNYSSLIGKIIKNILKLIYNYVI